MILVGATQRGLSISDVEKMDIGEIVDFIITYNNMHGHGEESSTVRATQHDFDNF